MPSSQSDTLAYWNRLARCNARGKIALVLACWFGTGLLPLAPGTYATLAAVPLVLVLHALGTVPMVIFTAALVVLAYWASDRACVLLGKNDPQQVVIDEVAGFLLTMLFLPLSWYVLLMALILFRVFDIVKPYPIGRVEALKGGKGVLLDDLIAGLYAHGAARVILVCIGLP